MDEKELGLILQEGEGFAIEFKENISGLDKDMVALANASGGRIFLGIDDNSNIKGIKITNRLKSCVQSIARNCDPSIEIRLEKFEDVLIIEVKEGEDKPYRCKEGFYMRVGTNSQKMSRDEIVDFVIESNKKTFDSLKNKKFNFKKDFDRKKLLEYIKLAKISTVLREDELLRSLGVFDGPGMNNAGILFFSKDPQKFFPQSVYTAVVYRDVEGADIIQRKEITGSLFEIVEQVMEFVEFYVKVAYKFTGKPQRETVYEYPLEAIREAVINSVMHKYYPEPGHNNILAIYPNRIEIEDYWIKPKNFILGETKFRRNPIITDLFFRIEFGEKVGSGIKRMRKICRNEKAPLPRINDQESYFYVTFKPSRAYLGLAERVTEKVTEKVTENQKKILSQISKNKFITAKKLSLIVGISERKIKENISKLKKKGLLKRIGPDKGGYWEVVERDTGKGS